MVPKLKIVKTKFDITKRVLVVSDIHGNLSILKKALKNADFTQDDILIIVGDIVEKGPESLNTLRYVMSIDNAYNVIGNVDVGIWHMINNISEDTAENHINYLEYMRKWKGTSLFDEMTRELGVLVQTTSELVSIKERVLTHFEKELAFLRDLPTAFVTEKYIFVHEGLPDENLGNLENYTLSDYFKLNNFYMTQKSFEKYIVVGHYPVILYSEKYPDFNPLTDKNRKIISIDGGCGIKEAGQLNLMILPNIISEDITFMRCDELPVFVATKSQEQGSDSLFVNFLDNEINIIEDGDEFSFIEHKSSGKKFWAPNDYISEDKLHCYDYTDYVLEVNKGDKLSLVKETSKGYIVKKDGIEGWYYGGLE